MHNDPNSILNPQPSTLFKGLALFTPGGDVIYCIDREKQTHWHLQLCLALQQWLDLPEPPHFLIPCYTATIDRWRDPQTQQVRTVAEATPVVLRFQALLNTLFGTEVHWQPTALPGGVCDPLVLFTHRRQFPQLWQSHDLLVRYQKPLAPITIAPVRPNQSNAQGYVLRLFVSGYSSTTERTLQSLHQLLGRSLEQPYTLKVVDVGQHPDQAERDQVSATPTLVRVHPHPVRRLVGNLDNRERLDWLLRS